MITHIVSRQGPVLLHDPLHVAAPLIDLRVCGFCPFAPVFIARESVGEYLVDYPVFIPLRHFRCLIYRYLIAVRIIDIQSPLSAKIPDVVSIVKDCPAVLAFCFYLKRVPYQAAFIRQRKRYSISSASRFAHFQIMDIRIVAMPEHEPYTFRSGITYFYSKRDLRPGLRRSEGLSVFWFS